ncbi:MAG: LacI family DNA-binding transcriptional regulator [Janthinobacterium lividum]
MPTTDPHASMVDVARLAGVSVATVSRALHGSPLVSAETSARVVAAADELSFAISRVASGLASGRLGRIGLLLGGPLQTWFNGTVIDSVYARLTPADVELTIFRIQDRAERDRFFTRLPARRNVDAMIVASFALTAAERTRLETLGVPLVYLNQRVRGVPSVAIDDVAGARDGVRELLRLGHRRIGFVRSIGRRPGFRYSADRRVEGFRAAMAEAGVPEADQLVVDAPDLDAGEDVLALALADPDRPTALAVDSDELAIGILAALVRAGLRAPHDLSLLGFDDHAMAARLGLSTVAQPAARTATEAATLALQLAAGETPVRRTIQVPTQVVLRRTTGAPARAAR